MQDRTIALARGRLLAVVAAAVAGAACSPQPAPRSYDFFLNDSIARDGTLARCDRDPAAAQTDIECANARRAALAVQLEEERARREALERESAAKIEALRLQFEAQRRAREAAEAEALEDFAAQTGGDAEPPDAVTDADADAAGGALEDPTAAFDAEESGAVPGSAIPRAFRD